jgi:DNA-binding NtrC family response regulator
MAKVLLVSHIAEFLREREQTLRAAGFEVTVEQSCAEAAVAIRNGPFDAAVLGFSLPEEERNQLARDIKLANPEAKIIMMYFASVKNTDPADAILQSNSGPQELLRAINHILSSRKREAG